MKHIHLQVHVGYTDKFATGLETSFQLFLSKAQDLVRKCCSLDNLIQCIVTAERVSLQRIFQEYFYLLLQCHYQKQTIP